LNQYEAMFLFDPTFASDFGAVKAEIERLLARAEAEIVFLEKWEERKLAYEIKGRKRGLYVLTYFKCDGAKIAPLERDARLSEPILRILVKNANGVTREQIERFMPQARRADESTREGSGDGKPAASPPRHQPLRLRPPARARKTRPRHRQRALPRVLPSPNRRLRKRRSPRRPNRAASSRSGKVLRLLSVGRDFPLPYAGGSVDRPACGKSRVVGFMVGDGSARPAFAVAPDEYECCRSRCTREDTGSQAWRKRHGEL
jgi:small subunit ribosomal protein S6